MSYGLFLMRQHMFNYQIGVWGLQVLQRIQSQDASQLILTTHF